MVLKVATLSIVSELFAWCNCSADEASSGDEDADNVDDDLSDDWSVTRAPGWTSHRATRRSNRHRQRSTRMNNFGTLL